MRRLAEGDRSAFSPVFARAYPLLRRFAARMLDGAPECEDAAQRALLRVFSRAWSFDAQRDALTWMFTLTAYECRTLRAAQRRRREEPYPPEGASEATPEGEVMSQELLALARELLGAIRPEDVEVLSAAWADAPRPSITAAAFRKRLQRALERVRLAWRLKHGAD